MLFSGARSYLRRRKPAQPVGFRRSRPLAPDPSTDLIRHTMNPTHTLTNWIRWAPRRAVCAIRGHAWLEFVSPSVTIHCCQRCSESRWTT